MGQSLPALPGVLAALVLGALAYGASIVLYIRGAQHLGATRSQMLFATAPVRGGARAWRVRGEPGLGVQIGAALLLLAHLR